MAETKTGIGGAAVAAAFLVILAWLGLLVWLISHTAISDAEWARLLVVLGSIEAVAFAAAGALLGTTIQGKRVQEARKREEKAEEQADKERNAANAKTEAAAKGKALATAIKARAKSRSAKAGTERVSAASTGGVDDDLVALSNELFPD